MRDVQQVSTLARQLGMKEKLSGAYKDILKEPYGYLLIDLSPYNVSNLKLKSHIFPNENMIVYM